MINENLRAWCQSRRRQRLVLISIAIAGVGDPEMKAAR
jgi:hypothetical protein